MYARGLLPGREKGVLVFGFVRSLWRFLFSEVCLVGSKYARRRKPSVGNIPETDMKHPNPTRLEASNVLKSERQKNPRCHLLEGCAAPRASARKVC